MRYLILSLLIVFVTSACSGATAPERLADDARAAIEPQQFALVPCRGAPGASLQPCQLLAAGGKYYLMGAPEGAASILLEEEMRLLDGVLLFSLLPQHVDGLDTLRNETWRAGRAAPLLVAGPEGTEGLTSGLDSAFENSDAEVFSIESPAGGFDASLLFAREVAFGTDAGTEVVNTGDLVIRGFYAPSDQIVYQVQYGGHSVGVGMCGGFDDKSFIEELSSADHASICNETSEINYILE